MANSASQEAEVELPVQPGAMQSADEFWQTYKQQFYGQPGNVMKAPEHFNDLNYKIAKFFGHGAENSFESAYNAYVQNWQQDYDNYLADLNRYYEDKAVQSARAWDEKMSSSQYSRTFEDLQKAGINPYMLIASGSVSPASYGSPSRASYDQRKAVSRKGLKEATSDTKGRDFALILLGIARLIAAL